MSNEANQIVPYVQHQEDDEHDDDESDDTIPATSVSLIYDKYGATLSTDDVPVEQITRMKRWRKRETWVAGITLGVVLLIFSGPIGGVAGGIAAAYATKKALKRREKKVVDKIIAMQYPLVYNQHGVLV